MKSLQRAALIFALGFPLSCGPSAPQDSETQSLVGDLTITTTKDCKRFAGATDPNNYCMGPVFRAGFGGPHGVLWELRGFTDEERARIRLALDFLSKEISEMNRYLYNNKDGAVPRHAILNCTEKYADRDYKPIDADKMYVWRTQIHTESDQVMYGTLALVRMLENHATYNVPVRIDNFYEEPKDGYIKNGYTDANTIAFYQTSPGYLYLNQYMLRSKITLDGKDYYDYPPEYIAGVVAHELLHRAGYMHGTGNKPTDYPTTFIKEFGKCLERAGGDRPASLTLANGRPRPEERCDAPVAGMNPITVPPAPPARDVMTPDIANAETTLPAGPARYEWDDVNKLCVLQPDGRKALNASCGQAEKQLKMQGSDCLVYINGDYRFTLKAGQDNCPAMSAGTRTLDDGVYQIKARHSQKCLEAKDTNLQQANCNGGSAKQKFRVTYLNEGLYWLQGNESNKCTDVKDSSMDNGAPVVSTDCNFAQSQSLLLPASAEGSNLLQFFHSRKCLTVPEGSQDNGKKVKQFDCAGKAEQDWIFVKEAGNDGNTNGSNGDLCQYKHKKDTAGGKNGQTTSLDANGKSKSCDKNGDWKTSCKDGNGDTDEVACGSAAAQCQYKHKKDTAGGKNGQTTSLDANGKSKSCDKNGDWKTSCKDGNGDTDEVACQ